MQFDSVKGGRDPLRFDLLSTVIKKITGIVEWRLLVW